MAPIGTCKRDGGLWNADICREVLKREPEILLTMGDPQSLSLEIKTKLLREYFSLYSKGGWRGIEVSDEDVKRLSEPILAPVIREIWSKGIENSEAVSLITKLIGFGRLVACSDVRLIGVIHACRLWHSDLPDNGRTVSARRSVGM